MASIRHPRSAAPMRCHRRPATRTTARLATLVTLALVSLTVAPAQWARAADECLAPANAVVAENCQAGAPAAEWDVSGAGDPSIQGFATAISVDQGERVAFKVDTGSTDYRIDIYRLGYYGGLGARKVATVEPTASLPQVQPECAAIPGESSVDCGSWAESASWTVPADAVSGIYLARPVREDVAGDLASHIVFVVRDDDGHSDLLFQTSDTTWQAYNRYGGSSLYDGPAHAHKVSYNRPFTTRGGPTEDWLFNAEYPMLRWLERNGYDVSYFTGVDSDRRGAEILEHKTFLSVGHDEYWSGAQRTSVESARDAGVNLAFFSGNEVYWKTRWEPSTVGAGADDRTLVSYKEGDAQGSEHYDCAGSFSCDPHPSAWTGLWRQNQAGHDGGRPENSLSGQISWGDNTSAIEVPAADTGLRFWRNAGMTGATTLAAGTLGYEFDWEQPAYATSNPAGRITVSDTTVGGKSHKMSLYRAPSGALVFGGGTVQWSWGLDATHDRGGEAADPRIQQATVNLLSDMGAQPVTLQAGLVPGGALDGSAPTATITDPAEGTTAPGGNVTVSGTAVDSGGVVAAVEVSTDGGATWAQASGRASWTYTFSASNGSVTVMARAVDDAANIGAWASRTFDVGAQVCPCSIFAQTVTGTPEADPNAVELGVKFRSDATGFISGIRFYKTADNTGAHTGTLWSSAGLNLGTVTFSGESATGWQEALFDQPVAIDADTTYVASYHTASGNYATGTSFAAAGLDSPPLHALQGGADGPNGVYRYGPGGIFPTDTYGSSNYLVDVVFVTSVGPDTIAPTIVARTPAANAPAVPVGTTVTATFTEPMAPATITSATIELRDASNALVPAVVTYAADTRTATLDPAADLATGTAYTVTVTGGVSGVTDIAGNPLATTSTWSFTTAAPPPPPPTEGPGGPILVVSSTANPFSRYYVEILRNEGLNAFSAADISSLNATLLANYDVVVLGEVAVDANQAAVLETWVSGGGNLIAMRPDPDLAGLLGLTAAGTVLSDGYLKIDTAAGKPGAGLVGETIQFHGTADRYTLGAGASALATLFADAATTTANPAVTIRSVGSHGGQAVAFTYDLARSVVTTRQGNPAWAGQERDGQLPPIKRSNDMFFGPAAGDPQPDWIDFAKIQIPQADEQQRLFANLVEFVNRDTMPLPRFWYFPHGKRAVVVMTGDDHGSNGTAGQFDWDIAQSPIGCSLADWECIRGTSYLYPTTPLSDTAAAAYEALGFEVSVHVNTNCEDWTPSTLADFYSSQLAGFHASFPSVSAPRTHRTHCITWSDWASQPKTELANDIRLDTNYYYWPGAWVQNRPGYFTGSGMPMRFADLDGSLIDVYQAATQMPDESGLDYAQNIDTLLDNALGASGYYGVVTTNMHTDNPGNPGQRAVVGAAKAKGVPVVSARQMLTWLDGRNASSFPDLSWNAGTLTFSIARGAGSTGLQAMLPILGPTGGLQTLSRGGTAVSFTTQTIKGIEYAVFAADAGDYTATFDTDTTAPAVSSVLAVPSALEVATVSWTTDEPATSRVDYGTSVDGLTSVVSDDQLSTSHSMQLTGLSAATAYHFRVTSTDAAGNTTVAPAPPAAPASFSTPSAVAVDDTVAHFAAGTTGPSTYVSNSTGGEVSLAPAAGGEFEGTSLPVGWAVKPSPWTPGGAATVGGGSLTVDGTMVSTASAFTQGRSLEFVATFSGQAFQHVGFVGDTEFNAPWAIVSTGAAGGTVLARTDASPDGISLGTGLVGAAHRYRIDWTATGFDFWVDGTKVTTLAHATTTPVLVGASDANTGGGTLAVDWIRVTPYAASGAFTSRVHDAGAAADWRTLHVVASGLLDTQVAIEVRTGDTQTPDATWSAFTPVADGTDIPGTSRYVQYRALLSTADPSVTPSLERVTMGYVVLADETPPTVLTRSPLPDAPAVAPDSTVQIGFSEPIDPASVTSTSIRLQAQGVGTDVPATVSVSDATVTLDPATGLAPYTAYTATVTTSVTDLAGNALVAPVVWSFTTGATTTVFVDTTVADFGAGVTGADTYVSQTGDGEVTLAPSVGAEFSGTTLPAGWVSDQWTSGGASVAGGSVSVDGGFVRTTSTFGPGRALDFVATFSGAAFQNAGLGETLSLDGESWAMFGIGGTANTLLVRTNVAGSIAEVPLGSAYLDSPHHYRIEWGSTQIRFLVDGTVVHTATSAIGASLRPIASDYTLGAGALVVDWMRMTPYAATGTVESRVFDAGERSSWTTLSALKTVPESTSVAFETRTGNSADTSDASWSSWAPAAATIASPAGRYLQYRALLATADPSIAPDVMRVELTAATLPPNRPPSADAGSVSTAEDVAVPVTLSGSDLDGDGLTFAVGSGPSHGTLSGAGPDLTYTPAGDYFGVDSFTFTVTDSSAATSAPATVAITVTPVNDAPVVSDPGPRSSAEGDAVTLQVLASDADDDPLTYTASGLPDGLSISSAGLISGTPTAEGVFTVEITVTDGSATDQATITWTVTSDVTAPGAPTGLTASVSTVSVQLRWAANTEPDVAGYRVYRSVLGGPFVELTTSPQTASSFTDTTAPTRVDLTYRVSAVDTSTNASSPSTVTTRRDVWFRGSSTALNGALATTFSVPRPAAAVSGDLVVTVLDVRGPAVVTAPVGWVLARQDVAGSGVRQVTYYRIAGGSEPVAYSWRLSAGRGASAVSAAYGGVDPTNPLMVGSGQTSTTSSITAPSVTTTVESALLVGAFGIINNSALSTPTGMVRQGYVGMNLTSNKVATLLTDQVAGAAGPTASRVSTAGAAAANVGHLIAFRPMSDTPNEPPSAPTGLTTSVSTVSVRVAWAANTESDLAGYRIHRSVAGGPFVELTTSPQMATSFTDTTAPTRVALAYQVTAVDTGANVSGPASVSARRDVWFRGASTAVNTALATSFSVPGPAGAVSGDLLVTVLDVRGPAAVTAPAGWVLARQDVAGSGVRQVTYYRIAGGSEPASYLWRLSAGRGASAVSAAYGGVDPTNPILVGSGLASVNTTSITAPSVTTSVPGALLVGGFGIVNTSALSTPSGMVRHGYVGMNLTPNKVATLLADQVVAVPGATGDRVSTAGAAAANVGQLIAFRPSATP